MKALLVMATALLLCSCASGPQIHAQFAGTYGWAAPASGDDPRLKNPRFYMDDDDLPAWTRTAPARTW